MSSARVVVEGNTNIVRVQVSPETLYDLNASQELMRVVLGQLGCPMCHSGRFVIFQQAESEFSVD